LLMFALRLMKKLNMVTHTALVVITTNFFVALSFI
jgi:hypothetical protein